MCLACALCRGFAGRDGLPRSSENGIHRKDGNRLIQGTRAGPNRMRRLLSDPLARTSYGWQDGTWSLPWAAKCSMKTSRPVDARLLADGEDPGLQSELGGEYTRPYGDCHERAARFGPLQGTGEGPGLIKVTRGQTRDAGVGASECVLGRGAAAGLW